MNTFLDIVNKFEDNNTSTQGNNTIIVPTITMYKDNITPYWTNEYKDKVTQLFTPTELESLALTSTSLKDSSPDQNVKAWFPIKWKPLQFQNSNNISFPLSQQQPINLGLIRTKKLLLKPSKEQKILLKQWMGAYRWVYNHTVMEMENEYKTKKTTTKYQKGRKLWYNTFCENNKWLVEIPPNICYEAMRNASHDYVMFIKKLVKGGKSSPPRCKKQTQKTFPILSGCINTNGIYTRRLGKMFCKEKIPKTDKTCRVMCEYNKWYLLIPVEIERQQTDSQWLACSIDPGIRTFVTVFSMNGIAKIGDGAFKRVMRLCITLDKLLSEITKAHGARKARLRRVANSIRRKVRNLVDDMHYQSLGWLFRKYNTLIIPECDFTSAIRKSMNRKIQKKSVRSLLGWAFVRFKQRAISVAQRLGKQVLIVNEAYTSKTANWTGEIVHNLGGRRTIRSGGLCLDRDINGALGIYLKALMANPC
jgi:putative transposase